MLLTWVTADEEIKKYCLSPAIPDPPISLANPFVCLLPSSMMQDYKEEISSIYFMM